MEVHSNPNNNVLALSPGAVPAAPKSSTASAGSNAHTANDINEVSSVDRAGQTSEFKHSNGEQYHSDGEQSLGQLPDDAQATALSLDITG
ncbi:MAG: hypothetical protein AB8B50_16420 [Pirellulaceae bacterium]